MASQRTTISVLATTVPGFMYLVESLGLVELIEALAMAPRT